MGSRDDTYAQSTEAVRSLGPTGIGRVVLACVAIGCIASSGCAQILGLDADSHLGTPKKSLGMPCQSSNECGMGECAGTSPENQVCCESSCAGNCESCREVDTGQPNGQCAPVLAGVDPKGGCASLLCGSEVCDGLGSCGFASAGMPCSEASCSGPSFDPPDTCAADGKCVVTLAVACADSFTCAPAANACRSACLAQTDCVSGFYCEAPDCFAQKPNNDPCLHDYECVIAHCNSSGKCKP